MALQTSGQISLNDVNTELGNASGTSLSLGSTDVRTLFGVASGEIQMSDGYGASAAPAYGFASGDGFAWWAQPNDSAGYAKIWNFTADSSGSQTKQVMPYGSFVSGTYNGKCGVITFDADGSTSTYTAKLLGQDTGSSWRPVCGVTPLSDGTFLVYYAQLYSDYTQNYSIALYSSSWVKQWEKKVEDQLQPTVWDEDSTYIYFSNLNTGCYTIQKSNGTCSMMTNGNMKYQSLSRAKYPTWNGWSNPSLIRQMTSFNGKNTRYNLHLLKFFQAGNSNTSIAVRGDTTGTSFWSHGFDEYSQQGSALPIHGTSKVLMGGYNTSYLSNFYLVVWDISTNSHTTYGYTLPSGHSINAEGSFTSDAQTVRVDVSTPRYDSDYFVIVLAPYHAGVSSTATRRQYIIYIKKSDMSVIGALCITNNTDGSYFNTLDYYETNPYNNNMTATALGMTAYINFPGFDSTRSGTIPSFSTVEAAGDTLGYASVTIGTTSGSNFTFSKTTGLSYTQALLTFAVPSTNQSLLPTNPGSFTPDNISKVSIS